MIFDISRDVACHVSNPPYVLDKRSRRRSLRLTSSAERSPNPHLCNAASLELPCKRPPPFLCRNLFAERTAALAVAALGAFVRDGGNVACVPPSRPCFNAWFLLTRRDITGRKELVESQLLSPHASAPDYKMVERNLQDEIFALSHNWEALP